MLRNRNLPEITLTCADWRTVVVSRWHSWCRSAQSRCSRRSRSRQCRGHQCRWPSSWLGHTGSRYRCPQQSWRWTNDITAIGHLRFEQTWRYAHRWHGRFQTQRKQHSRRWSPSASWINLKSIGYKDQLGKYLTNFDKIYLHPLGSDLQLGLAEVGDHPLTIDAEELGNL